MLTEFEARALLTQAADTIDVGPAGPLAVPPRRGVWPAVAAAALVAAIVMVSVVVYDTRDEPAPVTSAPGDDGRFRLGPDQVPSVFGYTTEAAVAMLEARGLDVVVQPVVNECNETPGRATAVEPGPGTIVYRGDLVTVFSPDSNALGSAYCVLDTFHRAEAWALVDYASGRGERPAADPGVDLDPVVVRFREWSAEVGRYEQDRQGRDRMLFPTPRLTTTQAQNGACDTLPARLSGRDDVLALSIDLPQQPTDGGIRMVCQTVYLRYEGNRIVDTYLPDDYVSHDPVAPADVIGNTVEHAAQRLQDQGYQVETLARTDCQPKGLVTTQQPFPTSQPPPAGSTVFLAYTDELGACLEGNDRVEVDTPASAAAEALVKFAQGGPLPPVADTVDLYAGNVLRKQLTAEDAALRQNWRTSCPAVRDALCRASVLQRAQSGGAAITQPFIREDDPCHFVEGELPNDLTTPDALSRSASFGDAEPRTCAENWGAQLWLDDEGRIFAVNLLLGNPP